MNKELFAEYALISNKIKELESKQDELKLKVVEEIEKAGVEKVEADYGQFYFMNRKTWIYPESIKSIEIQVKEMKKKSEEEGTATAKESKSLVFKSK